MSKLNLGCGTHILEGFINLDLGVSNEGSRGGTQKMKWDLSNGLPTVDIFGDPITDIDFIYTCHFIEHCTDRGAFELLKICYERMSPGGAIRILVPDFYEGAKAYVKGDKDYYKEISPIPIDNPVPSNTLIDQITYCVYQYGEHKSIWDMTKLSQYLQYMGFEPDPNRNNGEALYGFFTDTYGHIYDPKCPLREKYSLICQGVK